MSLILTPRQLERQGELYHQLSVMIAAGLPLMQTLQHLQKHPPSRDLRAPVTRLLEQLNEGCTFAEALRRSGKWIPEFDLALLDAGEQSGRLDACFKILASYYQERAVLARQLISDLLYPAVVLHVGVIIFPLVNLILKGNLLQFAFSTLSILLPIYAVIIATVYACQGQHGARWRSTLEKIFAAVPLLGKARKSLALARLSMALESLLNAGVPIMVAWELAAQSSGSPELGRTVISWRERLENGGTFSELIGESPWFPELFANLYHTGEVSGQLDDSLLRMHTLYQAEGMGLMKALSSWTPKIIYGVIMMFVAYKIISYYSASMAEMNQIIDGR